MSNYLLIAIIALKGVCLFICWKAVKMSKKSQKTTSISDISDDEARILEERLDKLVKQNNQLKTDLENMKN